MEMTQEQRKLKNEYYRNYRKNNKQRILEIQNRFFAKAVKRIRLENMELEEKKAN